MEQLMLARHERKQRIVSRQALNSIVTDFGRTLSDNSEPEYLATTVAAFLAKRASAEAGWDVKHLDDNQEFVVMMVTFVACDYLSQIIGARFEMCTIGACLMVFGAGHATRVAGMVGEVGTEFNRLATDPQGSEIIMTIGNAFAKWVGTREDAEIERVAGLMGIMVKAVS